MNDIYQKASGTGSENLKVAIVTDDEKTISQHFGRAKFYLVYDIKNGKIEGKETRPKAAHHGQSEEHHHQDNLIHRSMSSNIDDCEALIARGMGWGAYDAMERSGIKPFITDKESADEAVEAYIKGILDNHIERLH